MRLPQLAPSIRDRSRSLIVLIIVAILIAVGLKATFELFLRSLYELGGAFTADTPIYWAIGRGILNGRMPWIDLWESKPPGIFLLSALSILLTGDQSLGHAVQTILILAIPVGLAGLVLFETRGKEREARTILTLLAFGLGSAITLFMADRSGEYQVESFGGAFGALYALWSARRRSSWNRIDTGVAAAFLLAAIGMKEPFLFSTAAAALVIARSWKDFLKTFLIPLALAAAVGLSAMAALGMLIPYLMVYLPIMFAARIQTHGLPWVRAFEVERLYRDMQAFVSPMGDLAVMLFIATGTFRILPRPSFRRLGLMIATFALAVFLTGLGVGLGGEYWNHHFAVLVPVLVAIAAETVLGIHRNAHRAIARSIAVALVVVLAVIFSHMPRNYRDAYPLMQNDRKQAMKEAQYLDAILSACSVKRYLFFGSNGPQVFGFTQHSPEGPFFWMLDPPNDYPRSAERPFLRNRFLETVAVAKIAVVDRFVSGELSEEYRNAIAENFTEERWPCAKAVTGSSRYRILFRKT